MDKAGLTVDVATATNKEVIADIKAILASKDLDKIAKLMP